MFPEGVPFELSIGDPVIVSHMDLQTIFILLKNELHAEFYTFTNSPLENSKTLMDFYIVGNDSDSNCSHSS